MLHKLIILRRVVADASILHEMPGQEGDEEPPVNYYEEW